MPEHRHKQRVRQITDEAKYRRHRRKKLLQTAGRWSLWFLIIAVCTLFMWLALDWMVKPRP
jgi:hypothetical protein